MSKSNTLETAILDLILNGEPIANIADNAASSPAGVLYLSLYTSDPGEAGSQTTNEISYTGYARIAVDRDPGTSVGWTVSGNTATLVLDHTFAAMSGGAGGTVTHFGLGTDSSGAGRLLYKGTLTPNVVVTTGVEPKVKAGTTITED